MSEQSIFTKAIHAGQDHAEHFGALSVPIYPASVYAFTDADEGAAIHNEEKEGYYYGRLGNPTQRALESAVAELESAEQHWHLPRGWQPFLLRSSRWSRRVSISSHLSRCTRRRRTYYTMSRTGFRSRRHLSTRPRPKLPGRIRPNTKLFWIETPTNPLVNITDIEAVTGIAREHWITTVADNTFATPFNQRPLELGVDAVIHSATKYLGGHSDLTAGVLVGRRDILEAARHGANKFYGGNIAPQVAWLVLRGIKTLALRMERHNTNAYAIANMLGDHPKVKAVYYPGLASHQNHEIAARQMPGGFGGMIGFDRGHPRGR